VAGQDGSGLVQVGPVRIGLVGPGIEVLVRRRHGLDPQAKARTRGKSFGGVG
jgi:hypothetical protein